MSALATVHVMTIVIPYSMMIGKASNSVPLWEKAITPRAVIVPVISTILPRLLESPTVAIAIVPMVIPPPSAATSSPRT